MHRQLPGARWVVNTTRDECCLSPLFAGRQPSGLTCTRMHPNSFEQMDD